MNDDWSEGRLTAARREDPWRKAAANPRGMQGYAAGHGRSANDLVDHPSVSAAAAASPSPWPPSSSPSAPGCPTSRRRKGAVCTQALVNPLYGPHGLRLIREGVGAADVVRILTAPDDGREHRQLHVLGADGRFAAHTGADCVPWCGHWLGEDFSVAGNMLAGPQVVSETVRFFRENESMPLPRRLIGALKAGEKVGGDKRGKQSAALVIYNDQDYSELDLRVDDHVEPLLELARLEAVSREHWTHVPRLPADAREPGRRLRSRQDHGRHAKEPGGGARQSGRMSAPLLELRHLAVSFATDDGTVRAVDGIDLRCSAAARLGLVGESGCGKSVTSLAIMGLLPPENSKVSGEVHFEGRDLLTIPTRELRDLRGARLAMIFQEPMTSLNPVLHDRQPDRRGDPAPPGPGRGGRQGARHRDAAAGAHLLAREALRRLSAQAVGRHAPARHDRHGAGLRAATC